VLRAPPLVRVRADLARQLRLADPLLRPDQASHARPPLVAAPEAPAPRAIPVRFHQKTPALPVVVSATKAQAVARRAVAVAQAVVAQAAVAVDPRVSAHPETVAHPASPAHR
jgi:hypothetical protein